MAAVMCELQECAYLLANSVIWVPPAVSPGKAPDHSAWVQLHPLESIGNASLRVSEPERAEQGHAELGWGAAT